MTYSYYKFRLLPNRKQRWLINRIFGCCRFIWNYYLNRRKEAWKIQHKNMSCYACQKDLTQLKKSMPHLAETDSQALLCAIEDLDKSFQNFFGRVKKGQKPGYPKFKEQENYHKSYRTKNHGNIKVFDKTIQLPKLGQVKYQASRNIKGRILSATISRTPSNEYYISICCTDIKIQPKPRTGLSIGLDMGLKTFATDSNGEKYPNPKYLDKSQQKLARLQSWLSKKPKKSRRREKARVRVARLQEHIANQRKDGLQKLSTDLINRYDTICIEDLSSQTMVKNQHRRLARSITDVAWREFRTDLEYKAKWNGRNLMVVDRFFPSSQLCSVCKAQNPDIKDLSIRKWTCPNCGKVHDRDVNAAQNILTEGLRLLAQSKVGQGMPESASAIRPDYPLAIVRESSRFDFPGESQISLILSGSFNASQ